MTKPAIFSPAALQSIVQQTITPNVSPDVTHAVIGTVDETGAQLVASFTKKQTTQGVTWQLQAAARHDWTGNNTVGGKVILTW